MDHGEAGDEGLHLVVVAEAAGEDKHVAGEEGVPGAFRHHPHGEPVAPVCPGVEVLDVKVPLGEVLDHPLVEGFKGLRGEGLVHLSPPDLPFHLRLPHHELVLGASPRVGGGVHHQGAVVGEKAFSPEEGVFHEDGETVFQKTRFLGWIPRASKRCMPRLLRSGYHERLSTLPKPGYTLSEAREARHPASRLRVRTLPSSTPGWSKALTSQSSPRKAVCHMRCCMSQPTA